MKRLIAATIFLASPLLHAENPAGIPGDYKLVYSQDFAKPDAISDFMFTDPSVWMISASDGKKALEQLKQSNYTPAARSPVNIALLKDKVFGDVVIEADCVPTSPIVPHTDMIFIFGYQSPTKFYYAHVAASADDVHHNCFIVNDAPRAKFTRERNEGVPWKSDVWRHVRIERKVSEGTVRVFFENMEKPVLTGEDKTFGAGAIGFGSFDDTGKFANIRVWAKDMETKKSEPFTK